MYREYTNIIIVLWLEITSTSHFTRYTLLVLGWTPFWLHIHDPKGDLFNWDIVTVDAIYDSELGVVFRKQVGDELSFVTWNVILVKVAIKRWVHYGHDRVDTVNDNQVGCVI